jgi:hypothetical protein
MLFVFHLIGSISTGQIVLNLPFIGVQEIGLAVWLIVKEYNSSKIAPESAKQK